MQCTKYMETCSVDPLTVQVYLLRESMLRDWSKRRHGAKEFCEAASMPVLACGDFCAFVDDMARDYAQKSSEDAHFLTETILSVGRSLLQDHYQPHLAVSGRAVHCTLCPGVMVAVAPPLSASSQQPQWRHGHCQPAAAVEAWPLSARVRTLRAPG